MNNIRENIEILVLEDNPGDYAIVEDFLIEKFHTPKITHCTSFSASEKLASEHVAFSVILLDLVLIDLQKEELVEIVQRTFTNIPIVVLTGHTDLNLARSLIAHGVSDFLLKDTINPELLYRTIIYSIEREKFVVGLEHSKNTYQNLFNFSPQPMWLFDNDSLLFLDVNEAAINKYGFSKDAFLKMTINDIRPKNQNTLIDKIITEESAENKSYFNGVFTHILASGKMIEVEIYARIIEYNSIKATLVLANDITEKLHHINVIENQNNKLKKIAWSQSHETRAPLARFMGLVNLLEIDLIASEETKFLLQQLKVSANELDNIIHKMVKESEIIY